MGIQMCLNEHQDIKLINSKKAPEMHMHTLFPKGSRFILPENETSPILSSRGGVAEVEQWWEPSEPKLLPQPDRPTSQGRAPEKGPCSPETYMRAGLCSSHSEGPEAQLVAQDVLPCGGVLLFR